MKTNVRRCPEFIDTAHENLRSITLPDATPAHIATQFFAKCSDALVAVDTSYAHLSRETLGTLAANCTCLRALAVGNMHVVDVDGLVSLIEKCGPELLCLDLVSEDPQPIPRPVMQSIMRHCRSLEALRLESQGEGFEEDCIELVSRLGGRLKYLDLYLTSFDVHANAIMDCVADHCPNLEQLGIPFTAVLHVPNPPHEQQEGEQGQQPQPQQGTTNVTGCGVLEQTFAKLLRQCPKLQTIHPFEDFDYSGFTDPELKTTLFSMIDCYQLIGDIRNYFDHAFYFGHLINL
ncbi:hypothetical protein HK102_003927 [Quaeritorhiza haematococci]|nr:hypothetical protein HK102_003927 [Quaeritorhiza haematococci]